MLPLLRVLNWKIFKSCLVERCLTRNRRPDRDAAIALLIPRNVEDVKESKNCFRPVSVKFEYKVF